MLGTSDDGLGKGWARAGQGMMMGQTQSHLFACFVLREFGVRMYLWSFVENSSYFKVGARALWKLGTGLDGDDSRRFSSFGDSLESIDSKLIKHGRRAKPSGR